MSNTHEKIKQTSDERLGKVYRHAMAVRPSSDSAAQIMQAVLETHRPNQVLLWVLAYGAYIGIGIFLISIIPLLMFLPTMSFNVSTQGLTEFAGSIPMWSVVTVAILGLGIWRMETA